MIQSRRGFTLIEVLITIVLLAIMISGLMAMFTTFSQKNGDPSLTVQASELLQEKMEQIIADKENLARGFNYVTTANYPAENPVVGFPNFTRSVSVMYVNPAGNLNANSGGTTNYKNVTVTVGSLTGNVTTTVLIGSF